MADKIIVVDDEREIADLIGLYLENDGYEVHKFLNGADALSFVEKCEPAREDARAGAKAEVYKNGLGCWI